MSDEEGEFLDLFGPPAPLEPRQNPRVFPPDMDPRLSPNPAPELSLTEEGAVLVDEALQLLTDFGQRPYRVFSIVTRWSGGEEGVGREEVVSEKELLPTPYVNLKPVRVEMTQAGKKERGSARLTEISARYTEDDISEIFPTQLPASHFSFLEVRIDQRNGKTRRRRFTVQDVPWLDVENFQWVVDINIQQESRDRSGQLSEPTQFPERLREQVNG